MRVNLSALELATKRDCFICADSSQGSKEIGEMMDANDFNVIPVADIRSGSIVSYWIRSQGSSIVKERPVSVHDVILDSMSVEYALEKMLEGEGRQFLFTRNQMSVTGMITLWDFNSTAFRIHVYAVVATTESLLGRFLDKYTESRSDLEEAIDERFRNEMRDHKRSGLNFSPIHYMNYSQILKAIGKNKDMLRRIGFSSRKQFEKMNTTVYLRNDAAHVSRTIIRSRDEAFKVLDRLQKLEDLSFRVRASGLPYECWLEDASEGV